MTNLIVLQAHYEYFHLSIEVWSRVSKKQCESLQVFWWPQFHTPQFNTSVQHKRAAHFQPPKSVSSRHKSLSSTHPSVQHQKTVISTSKTIQFNTPLSSTYLSVQHHKPFSSTRGVLKWGVCWTECCVELKGVLNWGVFWTDGFFGVELRLFFVELTDFGGWKGVVLVRNWRVERVEWKSVCWTEDY